MAIQNGTKLNCLSQLLPEGLIVDAAWMERHGYSRSLRSQYVSAGWIERPVRGVYRRSQSEITVQQVLTSLCFLLGYPVSVGGRTALEMGGYAHFIPQAPMPTHLYSDKKLPSWLFKLPIGEKFIRHNRHRFLPYIELPASSHLPSIEKDTVPAETGLLLHSFSAHERPIIMSSPERAILELLDELPQRTSFHGVDLLMESLVNLRPSLMQSLLEECSSVKVKRLFFFFAERHQHSWLKHINRNRIDLGKGKRVLIKSGKLDPIHKITVPGDL